MNVLDPHRLEELSEGCSEAATSVTSDFVWKSHPVGPFHDSFKAESEIVAGTTGMPEEPS